jgi:steroid delta-isomerase-like uncharacterized protein
MKTITAFAGFSLFLVSAVSASSLEDQNKALALQAFEEILSKGNFSRAGQFYATDFINHGLYQDGNLEEDQSVLKGLHQAFSELVIQPQKLMAEGDLVTIYWTARGRNTGAANGIPATGRRVHSSGIIIWRVVDGRIKEQWSVCDQLSMMEQLDLIVQKNGN